MDKAMPIAMRREVLHFMFDFGIWSWEDGGCTVVSNRVGRRHAFYIFANFRGELMNDLGGSEWPWWRGGVLVHHRAIGGSFNLQNSVNGEGDKSRRSSEQYSW
jgi:hypothetical protein